MNNWDEDYLKRKALERELARVSSENLLRRVAAFDCDGIGCHSGCALHSDIPLTIDDCLPSGTYCISLHAKHLLKLYDRNGGAL